MTKWFFSIRNEGPSIFAGATRTALSAARGNPFPDARCTPRSFQSPILRDFPSLSSLPLNPAGRATSYPQVAPDTHPALRR